MRLYIIAIIIYSLQCTLLFAQDKPKADSLKALLFKNQCDSDRYKLLLSLSKYDVPVEGLVYAQKAFEIAKKNKDTQKQALALEHLSICHRKLGNYPEAIKASLEAMRIYDKLALYKNAARLQLQLGSHFSADKNYSEAVRYIKSAMRNFEKNNDRLNKAFAQINLGETYRLMGKPDSAAYYFTECLVLNKKIKNNLVQGYALGNLGHVHAKEKKVGEAKEELNTAIEILDKLGDSYSVSVYQGQLSELYIDEGLIRQGEGLLLASLQMAEKGAHKEQIRDISNALSAFYENQRQFEKALFYRRKYETYHDSLVNIDNVRKVEQLHSQYWLEKKEANIQLLEKDNSNKRKLLLVLSLGTALLLTLLGFLQHAYRQRKKAFQQVSEQNVIIEKREQEKALLLKELNHRVKNNLQMVAGLISLQARQSKEPVLLEALEATKNRIEALILIHQKLYQDNVDLTVKLDTYIRELVDNLLFSYGEKINASMDLSAVPLHIDMVIPFGLVINELVTNVLKYGKVPGRELELKIALSGGDQTIQLNIADNGNGLPGGYEARNSSMGLKLVHSLVKQLNGTIAYRGQQGCSWDITLHQSSKKLG